MTTIESLKPATKAKIKANLIGLFNDLGFSVSDLSSSEASEVTNKLNNACETCANKIVDDIAKMFKDASDKVITFGSASTQQSVDSPTESKGIKFG